MFSSGSEAGVHWSDLFKGIVRPKNVICTIFHLSGKQQVGQDIFGD